MSNYKQDVRFKRDETGFHNLRKWQINVGNFVQQEGFLNLINWLLMTPSDCGILTQWNCTGNFLAFVTEQKENMTTKSRKPSSAGLCVRWCQSFGDQPGVSVYQSECRSTNKNFWFLFTIFYQINAWLPADCSTPLLNEYTYLHFLQTLFNKSVKVCKSLV